MPFTRYAMLAAALAAPLLLPSCAIFDSREEIDLSTIQRDSVVTIEFWGTESDEETNRVDSVLLDTMVLQQDPTWPRGRTEMEVPAPEGANHATITFQRGPVPPPPSATRHVVFAEGKEKPFRLVLPFFPKIDGQEAATAGTR